MDEIINSNDIDMTDDLLIHDIKFKKENLEKIVEIELEDNHE